MSTKIPENERMNFIAWNTFNIEYLVFRNSLVGKNIKIRLIICKILSLSYTNLLIYQKRFRNKIYSKYVRRKK